MRASNATLSSKLSIVALQGRDREFEEKASKTNGHYLQIEEEWAELHDQNK